MATKHKTVIPGRGYFFDKEKHYHYLDGKKLSGCTTILGVINKPFLIPWAVGEAITYIKEHAVLEQIGADPFQYIVAQHILEEAAVAHTKKKDKAAEAGTDVHAQIETLVKNAIANSDGYIEPTTIDANKQVQDFITWATTIGVKFLLSEKNVFSRELWIGGIVDIVCEINGKVYLLDIKTSKYIYPSYWFQTSAYQKCLQEMGMFPDIVGHIIIKISDRTGFEFQQNFAYEQNLAAFKACHTLYHQLQALEK